MKRRLRSDLTVPIRFSLDQTVKKLPPEIKYNSLSMAAAEYAAFIEHGCPEIFHKQPISPIPGWADWVMKGADWLGKKVAGSTPSPEDKAKVETTIAHSDLRTFCFERANSWNMDRQRANIEADRTAK